MGIISSRHNALVKRIRMAIREHAQEIVVEGPKAVADAIAGGWKPIAVVERDVDVSGEVFDALTETRHPQSVIGLFERPRGDAAAILARRDTIAIARDAILVFGNEGAGVSREILDAATLIAIPMSTRVESLNVASSAAILLARSYDARSRTTDN
jgi:tRNA G18 (ribose-2'-O)-methylase SpoU